ncbi:ras-related protein rab-5c [Anaeramoeba flamelloides]|uniref:Ras-related protein rab-5c n=1 Tax=Anaeramoeba flamelloides TaxID=1746091 RepID=A0AAV7ZMV5_9EUKA|nr:ras-related protein rab-5c [Anaeramoeba flamelloides]
MFFEQRSWRGFWGWEPTIGASYLSKSLTVSEKEIKLQIWDSYFKAKEWVNELLEKGIPDLIIGFVGNKSDLEEKRVIKKEEAKEYCSLHKLHYFETSAKTSENVNKMFLSLSKELTLIPEKIEKIEKKKSAISEIMIEPQDPKKKKSCC